ncbi:MAG: hypothetical protein PWP51_331 [Clostridiales bacterium]|jgi:hypothetical protein|nr:hypothetical protein [Clostridiales bacterium]MDN5297778.1 hypothetical protein [Clostridiales bacterium]
MNMFILKKFRIEDYYLTYSQKDNTEWRMYLKNEYGIRHEDGYDKIKFRY